MAVRDLLNTLTDGAARVVDAPVRDIVEEVLQEKGLADRATVDRALQQIESLKATTDALTPRVEAAEQRANHLAGKVDRLQHAIDDLQRDLAEAREQTMDAVARADTAEAALSELRAEVARLKAGPSDDRPVVGPEGQVEVRGKRFVVATSHAGKKYSVAHNGAVRVGGRLVKKQPA